MHEVDRKKCKRKCYWCSNCKKYKEELKDAPKTKTECKSYLPKALMMKDSI